MIHPVAAKPSPGTICGMSQRGFLVPGSLLLILGLGCGRDPTPPPPQSTAVTWTLSFSSQQRSTYGGSSCASSPFEYCMTWSDYPETYSGSFTQRGDTATLVAREGTFSGRQSATAPDHMWLPKAFPSCEGYSIDGLVVRGDTISGTFHYQTDCHGLGYRGAFTGHR